MDNRGQDLQVAVRYCMKGQHVSAKPVFDGLCARCGELLYGTLSEPAGNKKVGKPIDIDDVAVSSADAQPPFLLRWPPNKFVDYAPAVFRWEQATNKLSLREEFVDAPPWKANLHHCQQERAATWLYCKPCHTQLSKRTAESESFTPFRDSASVASLRGLEAPAGTVEDAGQEERRKWARARSSAARGNQQRGRKLNPQNLVPKPEAKFWQATPEAPFEEVRSEAGRNMMSCCNLRSSMQEYQDERGRSAYACSVGETVSGSASPTNLQARQLS